MLARWPAPGRCKRRLAVDLGHRRAAAIQARLTVHALAAARLACGGTTELRLAVSGLGPAAAARWGAALGVDGVEDQGTGSLGVRLRRQVVRAQRSGIRQLVLIGSDLPELEAGDLRAAFSVLEDGAPMVLGPALDGGYWLIGLALEAAGGRRRPAPRLFAGADAAIAWGSDQVGAQTLRAAAREDIAVHLLGSRADLDRPRDLERWR